MLPTTPTEKTPLIKPNVEVGFFSRPFANVKRLCKEYDVTTKLAFLAILGGAVTIFYYFISNIETPCERFTRIHSNATQAEIDAHCRVPH